MTTALPTDGWPIGMIAPRMRVISDNDYSGDPDGLVQLAHHLLSPSIDLRCIIGSRLQDFGDIDPTGTPADRAAVAATEVVELTGRGGQVPIVAGSNTPMTSPTEPLRTAAVDAIIAEAMRDDTDLPLFIVCGAGLGEIASAWLVEPRIAERLTLVWIGGREHDDLADVPPGGTDLEYNTSIDVIAAQVVFNDSNLVMWQVPRNAYRTVIASRAELLVRMRSQGTLGRFLFDRLAWIVDVATKATGWNLGETYVLGDSPLVSLTALWTAFEPGPASTNFDTRPCPRLLADGRYEPRSDGRPLKVTTLLDNRTLLEDLYAKLALFAAQN
jgi:purine nucleosidase